MSLSCKWDNCNFSTDSEPLFAAHINTHTDTLLLTCQWKDCPRYNEKQNNKYSLQAHLRKHTGERPFKCTKCVKSYTRSDALNKHAKKHEGVESESGVLVGRILYVGALREMVVGDGEDAGKRVLKGYEEIRDLKRRILSRMEE